MSTLPYNNQRVHLESLILLYVDARRAYRSRQGGDRQDLSLSHSSPQTTVPSSFFTFESSLPHLCGVSLYLLLHQHISTTAPLTEIRSIRRSYEEITTDLRL